MKKSVIVVALNPLSGEVENWIIPTKSDKSTVDISISYMESQYKKPVEVYSVSIGTLFSWDWGMFTPKQKTEWVRSNKESMVYQTKEGFTKYGKSVIFEPVYDGE